jgi:hypothetical protein
MPEFLSSLGAQHNLVTAITAVAALAVSLLSIVLSVCTMAMQRKHNRRSVMPIGHISVGDYEDHLFVTLRNDGVGPMLIEQVLVTAVGGESKTALIEFMPNLPNGIFWTTFVADISTRALPAGKDIKLISLEGGLHNEKFCKARDSVRATLRNLKVEVAYRNVYGDKMPVATRNLDWFGRNIGADQAQPQRRKQ